MKKRITVSINDSVFLKLRQLQEDRIKTEGKTVNFSETINDIIKIGLDNK